MLPQLSDTELEIMKIVWGNGEDNAVYLYHGRAGSKRQAVSKEHFDCTPVAADEQRLFEC